MLIRSAGKEMRVIIDRKEGDYYGRTEFDSYEVDPEVLISAENGNYQLEIFLCGNYRF